MVSHLEPGPCGVSRAPFSVVMSQPPPQLPILRPRCQCLTEVMAACPHGSPRKSSVLLTGSEKHFSDLSPSLPPSAQSTHTSVFLSMQGCPSLFCSDYGLWLFACLLASTAPLLPFVALQRIVGRKFPDSTLGAMPGCYPRSEVRAQGHFLSALGLVFLLLSSCHYSFVYS